MIAICICLVEGPSMVVDHVRVRERSGHRKVTVKSKKMMRLTLH